MENPLYKQDLVDSTFSYFDEKENVGFKNAIETMVSDYLADEQINSPASTEQLAKCFGFKRVPEEGQLAETLIQELEELIIPHSINTGSPYFIGHMTSLLPNFLRPLSQLITTLNQNSVKVETAKAATFYEKQALAMLHKEIYGYSDEYYKELIADPSKISGVVTSGGTIANLMALQCGRDISLAPFGDVEEDGIYSVLNRAGFTKSVVLGTHLGHYSLVKAMGLLGMGRSGYIQIGTDDQQRLKVRELRCQLERCRQEKIHVAAIVGIAGTTECGSFDPLDEMADLAEEFGVYFHVDAAWGGALMFSDEHKHLLKGVKRADSVTIDGHKQLYLPMGIGVLLFKSPEKATHVSTEADYIIRKNSQDLGRVSIEGSRPAKVFYLQAALKLFGKSGYAEILDGCISVARNLSHYIDKSSEFELLTTPQSNIFLYRYLPTEFRNIESSEEREQAINDFNIRLQEAQKHRGKTFVSRTKFMSPKINESLTALRVVIANPLSSLDHCKEVLRDQLQLARELEKSI